MKITTLILLTSLLQVSAASFGQRVTIVKNNIALSEVFKEIRKQTGYNVLWQPGQVNGARTVNLDIKNQQLNNALEQILKDHGLEYSIEEETIMIKVKEPSFLDRVRAVLAAIDVRGVVTDGQGLPLSGATVMVKGTGKKAVTNGRGEFFLQGVEEKAVLVISYLGYESREVKAAKDLGKVQMVLADSKLEEVEINAGYYTVKDKERTGNISRISAETIGKQPVSNPLMAMQGRMPGVIITQKTGIPGGGFAVQIRGRNSINTNVGNDPLYIIDGANFPSKKISSNNSDLTFGETGANPLSIINPNDIESIEVLKDADATAIYGSRGANGVVLVTTKKGRSENLSVNFNWAQGISQVDRRMKLLNTSQYLEMRDEAFRNDNLTPDAFQYDVNGVWDRNKYIDWQKKLIGGNSNSTNATLNLSGGGKTGTYLISGNYYSEGTVFPGESRYNRGSVHTNINLGSSESRLSAQFTANYALSHSNLPQQDLTSLILISPNTPDSYDQYGKLNWENNTIYNNPMAYLLETNNASTNSIVTSFNLSYRIFDKVVFKTVLGYSMIKREELSKKPLESYSPAFQYPASFRVSNFSNNSNSNWSVEPQLIFKTKLGPGNINALVGISFQGNDVEYRTVKAAGFSSDDLMETITNATTLTTGQMSSTTYRYIAGFARVNYSIQDKYLLNITARRDGSSRFGPGKQFANFGAIGAGWIFSQENFFRERLSFLSFGKLRVSYGVTGNDQIGDYGYLQLYRGSISVAYQGSTLAINGISNPNYAWETNKKAEAAIQVGFLEDRLSLELAYYSNRSSNQLVGIPLPPSVGALTVQANLPAVVANTGFEFTVGGKILANNRWKWSTNMNLTVPKNKLVSYPNLSKSTNANNYVIGQPLGVKRIYNEYVDSNTGLYTSEDIDGNGFLDITDRYLNKVVGEKFYGGIQNSISYKNLTLDFLFSFIKQNGYNYMTNQFMNPGLWDVYTPLSNQPTYVLDRWKQPGDEKPLQKFSTQFGVTDLYYVARGDGGLAIQDASYVRLKNVSLNYRLPQVWLSRIKIRSAELYIQGQNLLTITNYVGMDPESQSLSNLPPLRTFILGVKLTF